MLPFPVRPDFDAVKAPVAVQLNDAHRKALLGIIEGEPRLALHGVTRLRMIGLCQGQFEEFRMSVSTPILRRPLRGLR